MDPYVGEIRLFAGNYAPSGWAFCMGQLLDVQSNNTLFSIIGNTFGGDGNTTFALPDLRGFVPMHQGPGPSLTPRNYNETGGSSTVTLDMMQMPVHDHPVNAQTRGTGNFPKDSVWASPGARAVPPYTPYSDGTMMNAEAIGVTGGGQPHNNMQPYLVINYIIALEGLYPPKQA